MYCSNCGNKLEEGALFCGNCGTKVGAENNAIKSTSTEKKDSKDLISLILGICSFLLGWLLNIFMLPVSIVGLILGIKSKENGAKKIIGIILNILAILIELLVIVSFIIMLTVYGTKYQEVKEKSDIFDFSDFSYDDYMENWG